MAYIYKKKYIFWPKHVDLDKLYVLNNLQANKHLLIRQALVYQFTQHWNMSVGDWDRSKATQFLRMRLSLKIINVKVAQINVINLLKLRTSDH